MAPCKKPLIGGSVVEYNYENAKKYDLKTDVKNFTGVLLESVDKTGPAYEAGMKPGDEYITQDKRWCCKQPERV